MVPPLAVLLGRKQHRITLPQLQLCNCWQHGMHASHTPTCAHTRHTHPHTNTAPVPPVHLQQLQARLVRPLAAHKQRRRLGAAMRGTHTPPGDMLSLLPETPRPPAPKRQAQGAQGACNRGIYSQAFHPHTTHTHTDSTDTTAALGGVHTQTHK